MNAMRNIESCPTAPKESQATEDALRACLIRKHLSRCMLWGLSHPPSYVGAGEMVGAVVPSTVGADEGRRARRSDIAERLKAEDERRGRSQAPSRGSNTTTSLVVDATLATTMSVVDEQQVTHSLNSTHEPPSPGLNT